MSKFYYFRLIFSVFLFLFALSCSRVSTLGLKEKSFSKRPNNIIWLQVAGLTAEQLSILRFGYSSMHDKTSFESSECLSHIWAYNLYNLRPRPNAGFLSQMTGSKNIKNQCSDYLNKPLWSYLEGSGYKTFILETEVKDQESLVNAFQCKEEGHSFRKGLNLFRMARTSNPKANLFHYQEKTESNFEGVYYDKSCQSGICYASGLSNIQYLWNKYSRVHPRVLFIYRNYRIYNALLSKDVTALRNALLDLEKTFSYLRSVLSNDERSLLLLTSSGGRRIEMPRSGRQWEQFQKSGKNILFKRSSLLSMALASGASSENFCGFYDESEVMTRILWSPKKQRPFFLK